MNLKINSVHFDADVKLENFIETKVHKLSKMYDDILTAEVYLRLNKTQTNDNKVAEIRLEVPGSNTIFAKNFLNAVFWQEIDV